MHSEQIDKLAAALAKPFPPELVSWRIGPTNEKSKGGPGKADKGIALCYVDARDVMQRLDEVCGLDGWQCRYPHANGKTVCEIGLRIGGEWLWRADGAGDTETEAEKGALSDAFKRAAVRWLVGRYLYDMPPPWVAIEPFGKSYKIAESELPRLRAMLSNARGDGQRTSPPAASPAVSVPRAPSHGDDAEWVAWCKAITGRLNLRGEAKRLMDSPTFLSDFQALAAFNQKYSSALNDKINVAADNERAA